MVDLSKYDNSWYKPGSKLKIVLWYFFSRIFINSSFPYPSSLKVLILKLFGAKIGEGVVIKQNILIKYPWLLSIGNYTWIGEKVWIDNLTNVTIGNNCCLSQGAMLLTGNHDFTKKTFDLKIKEIKIEDGAWIGAKAVVCPGVLVEQNAVLTVGSIVSKNMESDSIYTGNPALRTKLRCFA